MRFIEHVFSPTRLLLAWQAPEGTDRIQRVVGELRLVDGMVSFRYLSDSEDFREARKLGFVCHPAFRKLDREYTDGVMSAFQRRIPARSRGDFAEYLEPLRLRPSADLSEFRLLAYSGAKLPTDGFSLVWPLAEVYAPGEVLLEVAGFRYQGVAIGDLAVGDLVQFRQEPENFVDPRALRIEAGGRRIGYVKRLQRDAVSHWLDHYEIDATIERINRNAEHPRIFVFCALSERRARTTDGRTARAHRMSATGGEPSR